MASRLFLAFGGNGRYCSASGREGGHLDIRQRAEWMGWCVHGREQSKSEVMGRVNVASTRCEGGVGEEVREGR